MGNFIQGLTIVPMEGDIILGGAFRLEALPNGKALLDGSSGGGGGVTAHAITHSSGGSDEIQVIDLAGTFPGARITGTVPAATTLGGQAGSYYLARANHTGTQLAATISNFAAAVAATAPALHAASHASAGSDAVSLDASQVTTGTLLVTRGGTGIAALGAARTVLAVNAAGTANAYALLVNANIDAAASIDWTKVNKTGSNLTDLATRLISSTTGTLAVSRGGTGLTTWSAGSMFYATTVDNVNALVKPSVASVLTHNITVPVWVAALAKAQQHAATAYLDATAGQTWTNQQTFSGGFTTPAQMVSTIATGTAPLSITSTTRVANMNVELWDGIGRGTTGQVLLAATGAASAYGQVANAHVSASAAIDWSKISKTSSSLADLATRSAGDLATGTLLDARLSANVALLNVAGRFTGAVTGTGAIGVRIGRIGGPLGLGGFYIDTGGDGWTVFADANDLHFEHDSGLSLLLSADGVGGGSFAGMNFVDVTNSYKVNSAQVVGARKTGWAVATGTATRTTFDTATVTLPQLAQRLKALIDDLHGTAGHGLIGT